MLNIMIHKIIELIHLKSFFANLALPCPRITAKDFFYVNIEYSFLWFPP